MSDQTAEQTAALGEAMRNLLGIVDDVSAATRIRNLQEEAGAAKKQKWESAAERLAAGTALTLTSFSKSVMSTEAGMSKYNSSISAAGNAAMDVGKNFGLIGIAIGGFIKLLSMGAEAVLKQNDAMLKASDSLADFGAAGTLGAKQIMDMGLAAGYSTEWLGKWTDVTKSLGTDIIGLSATVSGGVVEFAKLSKVTQEQLNGYQALGISQEQLTKNQADYIRIQVQSGQQISARMIQDGSLRKASLEYTNNLQDLSAITGLNLEQAKKAMELATSDLAVNTKLANLQDDEIRLRATGNKGEADKIAAQITATKQFLAVASTTMDAESLAGLQSIVATGNFNELSAGLANGVPGILEFVKGIEDGSKKPEEFAKFMATATDITRQNIGDAIVQNKDIAKAFAYSKEALANAGKFRGKTDEEVNAMIKEDVANRAKILKEGTEDSQQKARNAQLTTEKLARAGAQELVSLLNGPVTNAFTKLQETVTVLGRAMAKWSDKFFGTDIAKLFETPAEIKAQMAESAAGLAQTVKLIEETKKTLSNNTIEEKQVELANKEYSDKKARLTELEVLWKNEQDINKKREIRNKQILVEQDIHTAKSNKTAAEHARESMNIARGGDPRVKLLELEKKELQQKTELAKLNDNLYKKQLETGDQAAVNPALLNTKVGSIGTLSPEESKAYAMAAAKRESGGVIGKENTLGFAGKYQFGAAALVDTGMIDKAKYDALYKSGHGATNKQIMNDPSVWKNEGGKAAFLKDEALQDKLFAQYTNQHYNELLKANVITAKSTKAEQAGYLMAAHLKGVGGATELAKGSDSKDAYNTSASEYYALGVSSQTKVTPPVTSAVTPPVTSANKGPAAILPPAVAQLSVPSPVVDTPKPSDFAKASNDQVVATRAVPEIVTTPTVIPNKTTTSQSRSSKINELLADKLDTMISKLETSNDLQEKLLRYSRA